MEVDTEELERTGGKPVKRLQKPNYPDFKETRDGRKKLQCECGSQNWQMWDDDVVSCAICGLPETMITFTLLGDEEANFRQEALMA